MERLGRILSPRAWLRRPRYALLLGACCGALGVLVLLSSIGGPLAVAHRQNLPLERLYGSFATSLAARLHAGGAKNPLAQNPRAVEAGRLAYTGSCAQCHGATGNGKGGAFSTALYPPATDLTSGDVKEKSDAELFWMTKNGLSFTGMPAFGRQFSDTDIWSLVAYMRTLQTASQPAAATTR